MTEKATTTKQSLQIEALFNKAFMRTKDRFLSYFLAVVLTYAMVIGAIIVGALLVLLHFFIFAVTGSLSITMTSAVIVGVLALAGLFYIGSWGQLAMVEALIAKTESGVMDIFKRVRPLVWNYVALTALISLFMIGLAPFGILSLFIVYIVWGVWSAFTVYVYLEQREKGLQNLWVSKAIVDQNFWGIFGRILLVQFAYGFVIGLTSSVSVNQESWTSFLTVIIGFFAAPFMLSYNYEIYKSFKKPATVQRPIVWLTLSVLGWVILLGLLIWGSSLAAQALPGVMEDMEREMILKQAYNI